MFPSSLYTISVKSREKTIVVVYLIKVPKVCYVSYTARALISREEIVYMTSVPTAE